MSGRYLEQANKMLSREARLEDMQTLADVLAERDRLRTVVQRVEALAAAAENCPNPAYRYIAAHPLRTALGSTDTRPTPAGAPEATQGAGDHTHRAHG